jgi:diaminopimelate decarboxylase
VRTDVPARPVLIGDVPATVLAERFGTPLYAYDAASIRRRYHLLIESIDYRPLRIYYSCKANAAVGIIRLLRELGAGIDACSPGDIEAARRAGYRDDISYTGVGCRRSDLAAVAGSPAFFIADSMSQIDAFADVASGREEIGLRVNPALPVPARRMVLAGAWDAKFGIHAEHVPAAVRRAADRGLRVVGLHVHLGSDLTTPEPHLAALRVLLDLGEAMPELRFVCLGGGLAVAAGPDPDYPVDEFGAAANRMLTDFAHRTGRRLELRLEPGSYLLMDAGVLLTTVTEIKPSVTSGDRRTPTFAYVDTSYNHVPSAVVDGVDHPVELARDRDAPAGPVVTVAGNLMQAGDLIVRERPLPQLAVGDVLVIGRCGAYTGTRAGTFNERPRPAEVLVDGGHARLIRRAETEADLFGRDV